MQSEIKLHVSTVVRRGQYVLMVQERKPENHGKWNLPGGHLEYGETLSAAATREVREETLLEVELAGILGVYVQIWPNRYHSLRFVFIADRFAGEAAAGDEILAVRWMTLSEIQALKDGLIVAPPMMRRITRDLHGGVLHPLSVLEEAPYA